MTSSRLICSSRNIVHQYFAINICFFTSHDLLTPCSWSLSRSYFFHHHDIDYKNLDIIPLHLICSARFIFLHHKIDIKKIRHHPTWSAPCSASLVRARHGSRRSSRPLRKKQSIRYFFSFLWGKDCEISMCQNLSYYRLSM